MLYWQAMCGAQKIFTPLFILHTHLAYSNGYRAIRNEEDDEEGHIGDGNQDYVEQLTLFETFSGAFSSITEQDLPTDEKVLQVLREQLQLESLEDVHIYNCMQYVGKLRHDFDEALKGILFADPKARVSDETDFLMIILFLLIKAPWVKFVWRLDRF